MRNIKNRESGASILEFALVLPVLILFLFGIIQYGWLFATKLSLMNTTATIARYSTVGYPRPTADQVNSAFLNNVMLPVEKNSIKSISLIENVDDIIDLREVKVVYDLELFFPFIIPNNKNGKLELVVFAKMR